MEDFLKVCSFDQYFDTKNKDMVIHYKSVLQFTTDNIKCELELIQGWNLSGRFTWHLLTQQNNLIELQIKTRIYHDNEGDRCLPPSYKQDQDDNIKFHY
jgi:hypothetical protein